MPENILLLLVTAGLKLVLTGWTFGLNVRYYTYCGYSQSDALTKVPAGIFLPTITIGACLGRTLGILL